MVVDVEQGQAEDTHHVEGERQQEEEEVTVVSPPHTVVHPRTVVVKCLKHKDSGGQMSETQGQRWSNV